MATQSPNDLKTYKCTTDLTAKQYLCMKLSGVQTVDTCAAITDVAVGVLQNDPNGTLGPGFSDAVVADRGNTKVIAGAAITAGAKVAPMASGKVQTAASTQHPIGQALETAVNDGDLIEIRLAPTLTPLV